MNVASVTKIGEVVGEVTSIEPKDVIHVGSEPVKVCVNVDLSMPMRRGVKALTNAGVFRWQKNFFERQPPSICTECYIINHSSGACKDDANCLAKAHEKPYYFGKAESIRKTITPMSSSLAPAPKTYQKKFVKSSNFVPPKDERVISMDFLLKEKATEEVDLLRLRKRLRTNEDGSSGSITEVESSSNVTITYINTMNQTTHMVTMGEKQTSGTNKKSQFTRIAISKWNKQHFGDINLKVDSLNKELAAIQALPFFKENTSKAFQVNEELQKWHHIQHEFNKQKSRDTFLKDVDNNTKYFHSLYKRKRARNNIDSLKDENGIWVHTREQVAKLLTENCQDISTSSNPIIEERFYDHLPTVITEEDNNLLTAIPTDEEIFSILKKMESWSAPGPEGFQDGFYKSQWNIIGEDVCNMVKDFFSNKNMSLSLNKTYISLILKTKKPLTPSEFRLIGLCNTSYKIISKILVSRIKPLMERIISPYQVAYMSGRLINDNTIIAHELIHSMRKKEGEGGWLALKVDISKAFDRLEWCFILKFMSSFGFCEDWIHIIQQCISTTSLSVLLNGYPCAEFNPSRDIRQGDPLSPYLFIMEMEWFSRTLISAHQSKEIPGIKAARGAPPSIICSLQMIVINFDKSSILYSSNLDTSYCDSLSHILGGKIMESNELYLGSPLLIGKSKVQSFVEIKTAFERRLANWQGESMCQAGRGTMVKDVLNAVSLYQMSTFKIPKKLIKQLDTLQRKFFWGYKSSRGNNPIAWNNMCIPKEFGGLSFRDLEILNQALLTKMAWRINSQPDLLCAKVIRAKYFRGEEFLHIQNDRKRASWIWRGIEDGLKNLQKNVCMEIKNGKTTRIWKDHWIINLPANPIPSYPSHENYTYVSELLNPDGSSWNISLLHIFFTPEISEKIERMEIIKEEEDIVRWRPTKDGLFTVKSAYNKLVENTISQQDALNTVPKQIWKSLWKMQMPHRLKHFIWKCLKDIVQTKDKTARFNSSIDPQCSICNSQVDSLSHLLLECTYTCVKGSYADGVIDPESAECMDILEALSWIKEQQVTEVNIIGDAELVVKSISSDISLVRWENNNLISKIKTLITAFSFCKISHVTRDFNNVADSISKRVRKHKLCIEESMVFHHG
ncbi:uncharacterized protein LOC113311863 [Papaver somniferum]|uniref:uncharacterized protein LOC113311863 n=1 Tax=Papaver somniferum TaxID=3469 RepID=UPI000E6F575E|nr:uncharacterized protein LOC113311863 [Papaver somniferum]